MPVPHLTLEYTAGCESRVDLRDLFGQLHQVVADALPTRIEHCKSRALRHEVFLCGAPGSPADFVHLDLLVLEGRSTEVKRTTSERALELLRVAFAAGRPGLQITVNVRDIDRDVYAKHPGTPPPPPVTV